MKQKNNECKSLGDGWTTFAKVSVSGRLFSAGGVDWRGLRGGKGVAPGRPATATGSLQACPYLPPIMYTLVTGHAFFNHIHI